jgi:hypothetical protein
MTNSKFCLFLSDFTELLTMKTAKKCSFPECDHGNKPSKDISYHRLPTQASPDTKDKWIQVLKCKSSSSIRVCSRHFDPDSDFERDLKNELLGLPIKKKLKLDAFPKVVQKKPEVVIKNKDNDKDLSTSLQSKTKSLLDAEVDILTELAGLQVKLVEKLGSNAELYQSAAAGLNSKFNIRSKEHILQGIRNEIYRAKTTPATDPLSNAASKKLIFVKNPDDGEKKMENVFAKNEIKEVIGYQDNDNDDLVQGPLAIFDVKGYHNWRQSVLKTRAELENLRKNESKLKAMSNTKQDQARKKSIQDGVKNLERRKKSIEMYKLKVVELRLWKKKWQSRQRTLDAKKRKRKEKFDTRRVWIKDQIDKGYMHKSCKVLLHSRSKFPFEAGFEAAGKRPRKGIPEDNLATLIKGVHVAKNGLVFPSKKRPAISDHQAKTKTSNKKVPAKIKQPPEQPQQIIETTIVDSQQLIEPIFTIIAPNNEFMLQQPHQDIYYIQDTNPNAGTGIQVDDPQAESAVIHYIQLDEDNTYRRIF